MAYLHYIETNKSIYKKLKVNSTDIYSQSIILFEIYLLNSVLCFIHTNSHFSFIVSIYVYNYIYYIDSI